MIRFANYGIFLLFVAVLSSCNTTKFLQEDEYLLQGNDIKFLKKEKIPNKRNISAGLATLYKQKENSNFFILFPREWFYFKTQAPGDTSKFDRWQRRVLAEKPAIYDENLANETEQSMEYFLQYKGYFNAGVFYEDLIRRKKAWVTYYVDPGPQFTIDSVFYSSQDTTIDRKLKQIKEQTLLKRGKGLDLNLFEQEKQRITTYLRNNGYAYFYPNYFDQLDVDTSQSPNKANLYLEVLPPFGDSIHQQYYVGDITVFPNFKPGATLKNVTTKEVDQITFSWAEDPINLKLQVILEGIYFRPGELFNQEKFTKTNKHLSTLNVFRFARIKQEIDSIDASKLNFKIELTPNYKMELGIDFEFNFTNRSNTSGTGNLFGLAVQPNFKNRNLFGGAELLVTSFSAGVEVNFSDNRFWNTVDLRIQSDLFYPKFLDYFWIWKGLNKIPFGKNKHVVGDKFYTSLKEDAATRVSGSYNYILVRDWYQYNLFTAAYGYNLQKSPTERYKINHVGIDLLLPQTDTAFQVLVENNNFLKESFGQQLFVSLLLRDFNYTYNGRPNRFGKSKFFSFTTEIAGAEIWAANALYNEFSTNLEPRVFRLNDTIDFSQYWRMELDFRQYKQLNSRQSLAARLNFGIARPFGYTSDVPYVKQFYVGGPNSIRAWAPRGLGPGGFEDPLSLDPSNNIRLYQTGDLKLEFNLEYRFDIFWVLKGALFLDAGNVWSFKHDPERCGSQFLLKTKTYDDCIKGDSVNDPFFKQIAVGGGLGLRFDFSYFIFRLDMGIKLRNSFPRSRDDGYNEWGYWENFDGWRIGDIAFNFGLGYPF